MASSALKCTVLAANASNKLARAIRPVPIKLITVSKGNSSSTLAMAGIPTTQDDLQ
jgi:hypothetical protein